MGTASGRGPIVITGASSGIGRACAIYLEQRGHQVFAGVRKEADAEDLRKNGSDRMSPIIVDITDHDSIGAAFADVETRLAGRPLQGLVNNAGITVSGPAEFVPIDEVRRQFEINLFGHMAMTQAFLPMLRTSKGRVVNVGSIGGRNALPFMSPYCASKFAMEGFTDSLRMELSAWGMHVSLIEPGSIATPLWEKGTSQADSLIDDLPKEAHELYGEAMDKAKVAAVREEARAIPPERVAAAIEHALTSSRPKTRYLVGRDARMIAAVKNLPDRIVDKLILQQLRLK
jgi:NAD(P)-dependent dehydrogenase (short-subunit alcohol dehydrogenase family)